MIKNPATGNKVKTTSTTGKKIVQSYLEGRTTLTKSRLRDQVSLSLRGVGPKIDLHKVIEFLARERINNEKQGFCSHATMIANNLLLKCKKDGINITKQEKQEFIAFFKEALRQDEIQLGGGINIFANTK